MGSNFSRGMRCTAARVSQASPITLAIALLFSAGASAGQYTAGTEAEFRSALAQAMADGDPSATIRLTSSFTIAPPGTSSFPRFSKPITIDTQGFEFIRAAAAANFSVNAGAPATFNGTYLGESGATPGLARARPDARRVGTALARRADRVALHRHPARLRRRSGGRDLPAQRTLPRRRRTPAATPGAFAAPAPGLLKRRQAAAIAPASGILARPAPESPCPPPSPTCSPPRSPAAPP